MFLPRNPSGKIGKSLSIRCTVSGVTDLTSLILYRHDTLDPVCKIMEENITNFQSDTDCGGQISASSGYLQTNFSSIQCSDESEYTCMPNAEASTSAKTKLAVFSKSLS